MNIDKYRQIFIDETATELNKLENLILDIDTASYDTESVNSIFRLFHRLKSSSAMMGLNNFSDLSHHAENLLSMINDGCITMEDSVVSMLLTVIDAMRNLVREADNDDISGNKPGELIEEINQVCRIAKSKLNMPAVNDPVSPTPNESEPGNIVHGMNIIRINVEELNDLIDMAGELASTVSDLDRVSEFLCRISSFKDVEIAKNNILSIKHKAEKLSLNIHTQLLRSKMVPAGEIFERLKRVIHDLATKTGKCIQVLISGADIELDRAVVDKLFNPLLHIVRNAVDHGIETDAERAEKGKSQLSSINISAVLQGQNVIIAVEDDGMGIEPGMIRREIVNKGIYDKETADNLTDKDIMNCLFIPGFSTKAEATELSGRGMGLDIVRENVRELKGSVDISSVKGRGTTILITIPQTLSIIRCIQVLINKRMFSMPSESILEITQFDRDNIMNVRSRPVMLYRGSPISMPDIYGILNITSDTDTFTACIIIGNGHVKIAIPVMDIVSEQDILIKPLGPVFSGVEGMLGVGIMSGGRMSLIVDTDFLLKQHSGGVNDDRATYTNS